MGTIYGCTSGCKATFAAITDWVSHEYNQHYFYEFWLCTENVCLQHFYVKSHFEEHLVSMHGVQRDVEAHRIGANVSTRFWCGFCAQLIRLQNVGLEAWDERWRHLQMHFDGEDGNRSEYADYLHIYLNSI